MPNKYYAQILIEVELATTEDRKAAEVETAYIAKTYTTEHAKVISAYIIQDPPEQEWLESMLCIK